MGGSAHGRPISPRLSSPRLIEGMAQVATPLNGYKPASGATGRPLARFCRVLALLDPLNAYGFCSSLRLLTLETLTNEQLMASCGERRTGAVMSCDAVEQGRALGVGAGQVDLDALAAQLKHGAIDGGYRRSVPHVRTR